MFSKLRKFLVRDEGAVTVDWVVMTAAIVGLCVSGVGTVQDGVDNLAAALEQGISTTSLENGN